jgi:hypothetical protein
MIKLPDKNWFLFSELIHRWQCSELDIVHLLIEGQLVPSFHFSGEYGAYEVKHENAGDEDHVYLDEVSEVQKGGMVDQLLQYRNGFQYLMPPTVVSGTEGEFRFFSGLRSCQNLGDRCFLIPTPLCMSEVISNGVVMAMEVATFEEFYGGKKQNEKPLSNRERDTLLTIIGVLCKEAKLDHTTPAKTAGLIYSTAKLMGVAIGDSTIESHLKKVSDALASRMK